MSPSQSATVSLTPYERPPCEKCGRKTILAGIEQLDIPDHDLRTFKCTGCNHVQTAKVRFR